MENEPYENSVDIYFSSKGENLTYKDRMAKFEELEKAEERIKTIDDMMKILGLESKAEEPAT